MDDVVSTVIAFLAMLNPFALFLYLVPIMDELDGKVFLRVLIRASLISFAIYAVFMMVGDILFKEVLHINFEAFRIFGGIVIFSFAYFYIVLGRRALLKIKEDLNDLASEIALPFMVGPGSISLAILMGHNFNKATGIGLLLIILVLNFLMILLLRFFKNLLATVNLKKAFDKNMGIFLRLNGFFLGAIGINMIYTGIRNLFFR